MIFGYLAVASYVTRLPRAVVARLRRDECGVGASEPIRGGCSGESESQRANESEASMRGSFA